MLLFTAMTQQSDLFMHSREEEMEWAPAPR